MNKRQRSVTESLQRVREFLSAHPVATPPANYIRQVQALDSALAGLGTQHVAQQASDVTGRRVVRNRSALVRTLRIGHMVPLRRIARALLTDVPGIEQQFVVPQQTANRPRLIATAKAMRQHAEPHAAVFIENARPENFLEQLDAAIQALEEAGQNRFMSSRQHGGATAGIKASLKRGRQAVKFLDAIVLGLFAADSATIAEWKQVKRVEGNGVVGGGVIGTEIPAPAAPATGSSTAEPRAA